MSLVQSQRHRLFVLGSALIFIDWSPTVLVASEDACCAIPGAGHLQIRDVVFRDSPYAY